MIIDLWDRDVAVAATNFIFSASSGAMEVPTLTAKRSLTRMTFTDLLGRENIG
jgi:hypothetical protein